MKWFAYLALTAWIATPVLAGEGECEGKKACDEKADCEKSCESSCDGTASLTVSQRIAKLEKGAANGCETSKKMLAKLQKEAKVTTVAALKEKVSACEKYADMGCTTSKKMLETMNAKMPTKAKKPAPLSFQVAKLAANCEKGCKASDTYMKMLLKKFDAKNSGELVAMVGSWETKAAKQSCNKSIDKLIMLKSSMPGARPAASKRIAKLAKKCEKGCDKSQHAMDHLVEDHGVKDSAALVKLVGSWETKAAKGCSGLRREVGEARRRPLGEARARLGLRRLRKGGEGQDERW